MTQEDRNLLLKDLSARLPYNVVIRCTDNDTDYKCFLTTGILNELLHHTEYYDYKPYLRPMSSMTEEERLIYEQRLHDVGRSIDVIDADDVVPHIDWLLAHHFDFRGLIDKGLALEAPEGMYKTE